MRSLLLRAQYPSMSTVTVLWVPALVKHAGQLVDIRNRAHGFRLYGHRVWSKHARLAELGTGGPLFHNRFSTPSFPLRTVEKLDCYKLEKRPSTRVPHLVSL